MDGLEGDDVLRSELAKEECNDLAIRVEDTNEY
jgi:hypothetical protein